MREKVIELLKSMHPEVDYENTTNLFSGKILDSIDMMNLLTNLEDEFDIEIDMEYMNNEHFDSVDAICEMIEELQ